MYCMGHHPFVVWMVQRCPTLFWAEKCELEELIF
jgi:hypothetical protein